MTDSNPMYKDYAGRNEITNYIVNTKHPTYKAFIEEYRREIPLWSLNCLDTSTEGLHSLWASRFVSAVRHLKPHGELRGLSMDKKYWEDARSRIDTLMRLDTTYTDATVDVLSDYVETARTMASITQRTTLKRLGKRRRSLDENIQDDPKVDGDGDDSTSFEKADEMGRGPVVDQEGNDDDSTSKPLLHYDDQLRGINMAIFNIGYKKLLGKRWSDDDRRLLDHIQDNPSINLQPPLAHHIVHILKGELSHDDVYRLKLSLSGIVNTIRRSDFDHVRPFLPTQHLDRRLDAIVAQFRSHVITNETKALLQQVIDTFVQGRSIEETMVLVHDLQRPLLLSKQRASQAYRALDVVATILKFMGCYSNSDTEASVLRRFMTILSSVFSNNSSIKLTEGETASASTKTIQRLNVALHEASQSQCCGRKIDILVKHDRGSNKYIELSSLEVKPASASPVLIKEQQNKKLRTNGAILAYLSSLDPRCGALQTTAAIDFVGSGGYIYVMTNIDGIFYARQVGLIMLPKSRGTFAHLTETMDLLFAFEAFMVNLGQEAQAALEHRESIDNICEVANVLQEHIPSPHHDIFITPTRHK